jgi:hypothetical protein
LQELLSLRALSQAVLGKDTWLALDQVLQLLLKHVQIPPDNEAARLGFFARWRVSEPLHPPQLSKEALF